MAQYASKEVSSIMRYVSCEALNLVLTYFVIQWLKHILCMYAFSVHWRESYFCISLMISSSNWAMNMPPLTENFHVVGTEVTKNLLCLLYKVFYTSGNSFFRISTSALMFWFQSWCNGQLSPGICTGVFSEKVLYWLRQTSAMTSTEY